MTTTNELINSVEQLATETWENGEGLVGKVSETFTNLAQRLRELEAQFADLRALQTSLAINQTIWPNNWSQPVAMIAYEFHLKQTQIANAQKDAARLDALWADSTLRRLDLISAAESLINNADECEGDDGEQVFSVSAQYITDLQDAVSVEPDILDMSINCAMQPKEQTA